MQKEIAKLKSEVGARAKEQAELKAQRDRAVAAETSAEEASAETIVRLPHKCVEDII